MSILRDWWFFTLRDKFSSVYPFHIVFAPNSALFSNNFFEKGLFFSQKVHPQNKKNNSSYRNIFSDFLSYGIYFLSFHPMAAKNRSTEIRNWCTVENLYLIRIR